MIHIRRLSMMMAIILVAMAAVWRPAMCQKIEKDNLDKDEYNLNAERPPPTPPKKEDSKTPHYVVTEEAFFDIKIANATRNEAPFTGRIVIGCFGEIVPITCLNFVSLAKGYRKGRNLLWYKNTPVHRIIKDFVVQMGDVTGNQGKGGTSIYGEKFEDENFKLSHRGAGWVSMANFGRDTNGSQFFILLQPTRWLDGKHVVFGKVLKGMDVIKRLGEVDTFITGKPKHPVTIVDSGVIGIVSKYEIPQSEIYSSEDMAM